MANTTATRDQKHPLQTNEIARIITASDAKSDGIRCSFDGRLGLAIYYSENGANTGPQAPRRFFLITGMDNLKSLLGQPKTVRELMIARTKPFTITFTMPLILKADDFGGERGAQAKVELEMEVGHQADESQSLTMLSALFSTFLLDASELTHEHLITNYSGSLSNAVNEIVKDYDAPTLRYLWSNPTFLAKIDSQLLELRTSLEAAGLRIRKILTFVPTLPALDEHLIQLAIKKSENCRNELDNEYKLKALENEYRFRTMQAKIDLQAKGLEAQYIQEIVKIEQEISASKAIYERMIKSAVHENERIDAQRINMENRAKENCDAFINQYKNALQRDDNRSTNVMFTPDEKRTIKSLSTDNLDDGISPERT